MLGSSGIRVEGFFGDCVASNTLDETCIAICTIEKANSLINRMIQENRIDTIGMVVIDEVHLISDPNRGYILELLLAKILYCSSKNIANIRIVAMSATLPNADDVKHWLNAEFYKTDYRPIELCEMIKIESQIYDRLMNPIRILSENDLIKNDPGHVAELCIETIAESAAVIVFCSSIDNCEKVAKLIAQNIGKLKSSKTSKGEIIRKEINQLAIEEIKDQLRNSPAGKK